MSVEMPVPKSPLKKAGTKRISGCVSALAGQERKNARGAASTAAPLARLEWVVTQPAVRLSVGGRRRVVGYLRPLRAQWSLGPLGTFRPVGAVRAIGGDAIGPLSRKEPVEVLQSHAPVLLDARQGRLQGRLRLVGGCADHFLKGRDALVEAGRNGLPRARQTGRLGLAVPIGAVGLGIGFGLHRLLVLAARGVILERGDRLVVSLLGRLDGALDPRLRLLRDLGEKIGQDLDVPGGCFIDLRYRVLDAGRMRSAGAGLIGRRRHDEGRERGKNER